MIDPSSSEEESDEEQQEDLQPLPSRRPGRTEPSTGNLEVPLIVPSHHTRYRWTLSEHYNQK
jgi:hypothetical protein